MENSENNQSDSFAALLAKDFVWSAVMTAGSIAGFIAVGAIANKLEARKLSKSHQNTTK